MGIPGRSSARDSMIGVQYAIPSCSIPEILTRKYFY